MYIWFESYLSFFFFHMTRMVPAGFSKNHEFEG